MKKGLALLLIFCMIFTLISMPIMAAADDVYLFLTGENFESNLGTWALVNEGDAFRTKLIRSTILGYAVQNAKPAITVVEFPKEGEYFVWVSSKDFEAGPGTRTAHISIGGIQIDKKIGVHSPGYEWELIGSVKMPKGNGEVKLMDTRGNYCRIDGIMITTNKAYNPTRENMEKDYQAYKVDPSKQLTANITAEAGAANAESTPAPTKAPEPAKVLVPRPIPTPKPQTIFSDLTNSFSWAKDSIYFLSNKAIIKGLEKSVFAPNNNITRAEFVTLINGITNIADKEYKNAFSDVASGQWFASKVQAAYDADLIDVALIDGGKFLPDQAITREEMTSLIVKAYEKLSGGAAPIGSDNSFADSSDVSDWAKEYVGAAVSLGVIQGIGNNKFAPKENANRAQSAVMIHRILGVSIKDDKSITVIADGIETEATTVKQALEIAKGKESIILLGGGKHFIDEPLVIDQSFANKKLTIKAKDWQRPILSGGMEITNWEVDNGRIFKAKVNGVEDFRQLYINDERAIRARFPNADEYFYFPESYNKDGFVVKAEALEMLDLKSLSKYKDTLELATTMAWMNKRLRVNDIIVGNETATLQINPIEWTALTTGPQGTKMYQGAPYWMENAYEFIDQPYEWFFDKKEGYVYVYAPEGIDLKNATVVVPKIDRIVSIEGSQDNTVGNVTMEGIEFSYSGWIRPNQYGFVDVQANSILPIPENIKKDDRFRHSQKKDKLDGAIYANYANNIEIKNCIFSHLGGNGITFDMGGQNVSIENNVVYDVSGNGIEVGSDAFKNDSGSMITKNVVIDNNYVYNVANEYLAGVGILVMFADGISVTNNYIKQVPYSGMSISWGWDEPTGSSETGNFTIRNNRVEDFGLVTNDAGGIYTANPPYGNNVLENNYVKGNYNTMYDKMLVGIYHDAKGGNWLDQNNVVENVNTWIHTGSTSDSLPKTIIDNIYINVPSEKSRIVNKDLVTVKNIVEIQGDNWSNEAEKIIENSGLSPNYKYLLSVPTGMVEIKMFPYIIYTDMGDEMEHSFEIINKTANDITVNYSSNEDNSVLKEISGKLELKPGEGKIVNNKITVSEIQYKQFNCDIMNFSYNGRTIQKKIGVHLFLKKGNLTPRVFDKTTVLDYMDPSYSELAGGWASSSLKGFEGRNTMYGYWKDASCMWAPLVSGEYEVAFFNPYHEKSSRKVKIEVIHKDGIFVKEIDQTTATNGVSEFIELGKFKFAGTPKEGVRVTNLSEDNQSGFLRICGVRFKISE